MSRPEAVRTAWSLVTLNVRELAEGPVPAADWGAVVAAMEDPADWGAVVAVLAELAAMSWVNDHATAGDGLAHAAEVALMLAAGDAG